MWPKKQHTQFTYFVVDRPSAQFRNFIVTKTSFATSPLQTVNVVICCSKIILWLQYYKENKLDAKLTLGLHSSNFSYSEKGQSYFDS